MHMIVHAAYFDEQTTFAANNAANVLVEIGLQCRSNQWLSIFRAENKMEQQLGAGTSHNCGAIKICLALPGQKTYGEIRFRGFTPPAGRTTPRWGELNASGPSQKFKITLQMDNHMSRWAG